MKLLLLLSALSLSSIAAYFSIVGLSTIFPGSLSSIITMAVALEVAKIIVAIWAHLNWVKISFLTKSYLSFAVFVLMGITSAGIFGFLSKSHIEHSSSSTFLSQEISEIERKIAIKEEKISREQEAIKKKQSTQEKTSTKSKDIEETLKLNIESIYDRLDKEVINSNTKLDKLLSRSREMDLDLNTLRNQKVGIFSSNRKKIEDLENSQKEERDFINSETKKISNSIEELKIESQRKVEGFRQQILDSQNKEPEVKEEDLEIIKYYENNIDSTLSEIEELNLEKFDINSKKLSIENELGPIKYIAEVVSDFGGPPIGTERSIRIVIILIVLVFDPLAIVMIICASKQFLLESPKPEPPKPEPPKPEPPKPEPPKPEPIEIAPPEPAPAKKLDKWLVKKNKILLRIKSSNASQLDIDWFCRWVVSGKPNNKSGMIKVKEYGDFLNEKGGIKYLTKEKIMLLKSTTREKDGYKWIESVHVPNPGLI